MIPRPLGAVLAAFLALGVVYALATPPGEAGDEPWHYAMVQQLQRGLGLPVQQPTPEANATRQEGSQPPLYYAAAAALTFWADDGLPGESFDVNPHAQLGIPLAVGNKNYALRDPRGWEAPHARAIFGIRLVGIALSALSVWLVHAALRGVLPNSPGAATMGAVLTAFNPMFLFISASVNNDTLMTTLGLAGLVGMLAVLRRPVSVRDGALLGGLVGLAALTKLTAIALLPLGLAALAWAGLRQRRARRAVSACFAFLSSCGVVAGWWYLRNLALYGEPTGVSMMLRIVNTRNPPPAIPDLVAAEYEGFWYSFVGLFGGVNILAESWTYLVWAVVLTVGSALGLALAVRSRPIRGWEGAAAALLLAGWTGAVAAGLLRWSQLTLASQGRLLFPAMAGVVALAAFGLAALPARARAGVAALLALIAFSLPFRVIAPAYAAPIPLDARAIDTVAPRLDIDFGGVIRLVSVQMPEGSATFGSRQMVVATWQLLAPTDRDYSVSINLLGRINRSVGQVDTFPGLGSLRTSTMPVGALFQDRYSIEIVQQTEGPTMLRAEARVYDIAAPGMPRLPASARGEPLGTSPVVGTVRLGDPPLGDLPTVPLAARFANGIRVDGFTFGFSERVPNDSRPPAYGVDLFLRTDSTLERRLVITAQLVVDGAVYSQHDSEPVAAAFPTILWRPGERVVDRRELRAPDGPVPPPSNARVLLALYDRATGERIRLEDGTDAILALPGPIQPRMTPR